MRKWIVTGIVALSLTACQKKQQPEAGPQPEVVFKYGLMCGWESFNDTLEVSQDSIYMSINRTSPRPNGTYYTTHMATPAADWQNLLDSLDWQKFTQLQLSSYNIGADGCDYWLIIERDGVQHAISFDEDDTLGAAEPVVRQLDKLWAGIGPWPP